MKTFSLLRVALGTAVGILILAAIAWHQGLFQPIHLPHNYQSANSIMVSAPYQHAGTWVFDDRGLGLNKEPFVAGVPEMIDDMVKDIPHASEGFRLLFSAQPFPGYTHKLTWLRGDKTGNWYYCEQTQKEGWLCPAMFKYFRESPKEIYAKAEAE